MEEGRTTTAHQPIETKDGVLLAVDSLEIKIETITNKVKDLVKKLEQTEKMTPETMADV